MYKLDIESHSFRLVTEIDVNLDTKEKKEAMYGLTKYIVGLEESKSNKWFYSFLNTVFEDEADKDEFINHLLSRSLKENLASCLHMLEDNLWETKRFLKNPITQSIMWVTSIADYKANIYDMKN